MFLSQGYDGTSMDAIAESVGALVRYFDKIRASESFVASKNEIQRALVAHDREAARAAMDRSLAALGDDLEQSLLAEEPDERTLDVEQLEAEIKQLGAPLRTIQRAQQAGDADALIKAKEELSQKIHEFLAGISLGELVSRKDGNGIAPINRMDLQDEKAESVA